MDSEIDRHGALSKAGRSMEQAGWLACLPKGLASGAQHTRSSSLKSVCMYACVRVHGMLPDETTELLG